MRSKTCAIPTASALAGLQGPRRMPHADGLGCRREHAGFSTGKPWLPVPVGSSALAVRSAGGCGERAPALSRHARLPPRPCGLLDGGMRFLDTMPMSWPSCARRRRYTALHLQPASWPQEVLLPDGITIRETCAMPGFGEAHLDGRTVKLEAFDVFCAGSLGRESVNSAVFGPNALARRRLKKKRLRRRRSMMALRSVVADGGDGRAGGQGDRLRCDVGLQAGEEGQRLEIGGGNAGADTAGSLR